MKFIFLTQPTDTATFDGPSGERYVINKDMPFKVENTEDIDFFKNNPRFKQVTLLSKLKKDKPKKSEEELFKESLESIKGLTKKSIDKVIEVYVRESEIKETILEGSPLDGSISKKQQELLIKYYMGE